MSEQEIIPLILMLLPITAWTAVGWFRVYKLAETFQQERYRRRRYICSLIRNREESAYGWTLLCIVALVLIYGLFLYAVSLEIDPQLNIVFFTLIHLALAAIAIRHRPRTHAFTPSGRTMRLMITAIIIDAIPAAFMYFCLLILLSNPVVPLYLADSDWGYNIQENYAGVALWITLAELPAFAFAPSALSIANSLLWPVEKVLAWRFGH